MIRILHRTPSAPARTDLTIQDLPSALVVPDSFTWLDLVDEAGVDIAPVLERDFGFHRLAIDDALVESHAPKLDDWGAYTYVNLHSVEVEGEHPAALRILEADIFLGQNYIVTHQRKPAPAMDRVWAAVIRDERLAQRGASFVLYHLTDELVADVLPVVEALGNEIDDVEDRIFDSPDHRVLEQIFGVRRSLLQLRRVLGPEREVLAKLARGDARVVPEADRVYFRDVYDHLFRLFELSEGLRDLASGALDTYISVQSNRLNEVMKTLTIITTLFMPLSFLASFFGMNFFLPPAGGTFWIGPGLLVVVLGLMVLLPLAMLGWMRRRAWM
jgi:magnesium transporter